MTREDHLLTILAEECAEVAQRAAKALRFGLGECQPGQELCNRERLEEELRDLMEAARMLEADGSLTRRWHWEKPEKRQKVERFLELSASLGRLNEPQRFAQPCSDHEYIQPGCPDCGRLE